MVKFNSKEIGLLSAWCAAVFAWTYFVSFRSPIVVDVGVLVDRSWRIVNGQVPGKDFYCPTTPFTYLAQAFLFKMLSPSVLWSKIYLALQMSAMLLLGGIFYKKVLNCGFISFAIALPMTAVWLPGVTIMIPWYDVDATFFSFITLLALGAAHSDFSRRGAFMAVAGVCAGLSFMSKQNVGGACWVAAGVYILAMPTGLKGKVKDCLLFGLGVALIVAAFAAYFIRHHAFHEAWDWMFHRAMQRHGEGNLLQSMLESTWNALTGPRNHFIKFLLPFYLWGIWASWKKRERLSNDRLFFCAALYCLAAMWLGMSQEGGVRYSNQQAYLGPLSIILIQSVLGDFQWRLQDFYKNGYIFILAPALGLMLFWGASMRWRQPYKAGDISWTVRDSRIEGAYFRKQDYDYVKGLIDFEKTIPKNERVFLMPDPLFFYFATDRISPVPMTHFLVSGWELNEEEQRLLPDILERADVRWVIVGKEEYFDTGFLRLGLREDWKTALRNNHAMMSRSDYTLARDFIDSRYEEVPGPDGFWVLKRRGSLE